MSAGQLNAPADLKIDFGSHVADSLRNEEEKIDVGAEMTWKLKKRVVIYRIQLGNKVKTENRRMKAIRKKGLLQKKWLSEQIPPKTTFKWKKEDISKRNSDEVPLPLTNVIENVTPTSIFELVFDDEVVNVMVEMTNLYVKRDKIKHNFSTDAAEMCLFIAMLLSTGYNHLPRRKLYWENLPDVNNCNV